MTVSMDTHPNGRFKLAYIIGTYPLLTTTFIDREIRLLRQRGVELQVISIRRSHGQLSPEQEQLSDGVIYLLPVKRWQLIAAHLFFGCSRPLTYWRTLFFLLKRTHPDLLARLKTVLHFGSGVYVAYLLRSEDADHLHAHFVDRAATAALIAARLLERPYSITAHANDIYVNPVLLTEKMAEAKFVATCTGYNRKHLSRLEPKLAARKLHCIYHGLDISEYDPPVRKTQNNRPLILAVGQLKEKKGFSYLLQACRMLHDQGRSFVCRIAGDGPLHSQLAAQIAALELTEKVTLCGALPHQQIIALYRSADLFVLPCITGQDGDRDGIPNVILEAMAMELPVISTHHSSIPEVVKPGINGMLVPPADAAALCHALAALLDDPEERTQLGRQGRQGIKESFSVEKNVERLLAHFEG